MAPATPRGSKVVAGGTGMEDICAFGSAGLGAVAARPAEDSRNVPGTPEMRVTEQPNRRRQSTLLAVPLLAVALWLGACGYKPLSETRPDAESGTVAGTAVPPASGPTVSTGIAVGEEARKNRYGMRHKGGTTNKQNTS